MGTITVLVYCGIKRLLKKLAAKRAMRLSLAGGAVLA